MRKKLRFIETLRVEEGRFVRPEPHLWRMLRTVREVFGQDTLPVDLREVPIPADLRTGVVKCRIVYDRTIREIAYTPYVPRRIESLRLIEAAEELDYRLKYEDRSALLRLQAERGDCDEVLIVRGGAITDTSYSNVAFFDGKEYVTPDTYLLDGTRRQHLLRQGILREERLTPADLLRFERVVLINALLGLEDNISVPIERIERFR